MPTLSANTPTPADSTVTNWFDEPGGCRQLAKRSSLGLTNMLLASLSSADSLPEKDLPPRGWQVDFQRLLIKLRGAATYS